MNPLTIAIFLLTLLVASALILAVSKLPPLALCLVVASCLVVGALYVMRGISADVPAEPEAADSYQEPDDFAGYDPEQVCLSHRQREYLHHFHPTYDHAGR
jgi:hypothetical protein